MATAAAAALQLIANCGRFTSAFLERASQVATDQRAAALVVLKAGVALSATATTRARVAASARSTTAAAVATGASPTSHASFTTGAAVAVRG